LSVQVAWCTSCTPFNFSSLDHAVVKSTWQTCTLQLPPFCFPFPPSQALVFASTPCIWGRIFLREFRADFYSLGFLDGLGSFDSVPPLIFFSLRSLLRVFSSCRLFLRASFAVVLGSTPRGPRIFGGVDSRNSLFCVLIFYRLGFGLRARSDGVVRGPEFRLPRLLEFSRLS